MAVNLNYTMTPEVIDDCIAQCGIRHVLTSRRLIERFNLKLNAEIVFLEDFKDKATRRDKLAAAAATWLMPVRWLERRLGLTKLQADDLLTIIFTSGSTGRPKGVMLTHRNVGSNIWAVDQILRLADDDVLVGILPIFHSFGYTTTMWTVLTLAAQGHLSLQSAGSPRSRQALPPARRDDHDRHAHVPAGLLAAVRAGGFRQTRRGLHRGRAAFAGRGRRVRAAIRRPPGRGLRRHRAFAGRLGKPASQPRRQHASIKA